MRTKSQIRRLVQVSSMRAYKYCVHHDYGQAVQSTFRDFHWPGLYRQIRLSATIVYDEGAMYVVEAKNQVLIELVSGTLTVGTLAV